MKIMNKFTTLLSLFSLVLGVISCEKSDNETQVKLGFKSYDAEEDMLKSATAEGFSFDEAYIIIEKIELKKNENDEAEGDDETDDMTDTNEYDFYGPYHIDLIAGTSAPELPLTEFEPGIYNKLEAEMIYDEELGYSFYILGNFSDQENDFDFEFTYTQSEDFKIENPDGFEITEEQINEIWAIIDLSLLFKDVDLSMAEVDEDGVIRLNKDSNRDLADIIESNLEEASELGTDDDDDGEIDD